MYVAAVVNRATARGALGDREGAIKDFTHAIRMEPGNATLYNQRGSCWEEEGDMERAMRDYNKAIELAS